MKIHRFVLLSAVFFSACALQTRDFTSTSMPSPPDYSNLENWAAHPALDDYADRVPNGQKSDQSETPVDVFFLHPTTLIKKPRQWNASLGDAKLNQKTDETTILYQASIFNAAGRVFAPRYRQAHLNAFYSKDKKAADAALDLAYEDIKSAFEYYLKNENQNRPIIIVGHSQGALHGKRLLADYFDGKKPGQRLVAAYLVGWPIRKSEFRNIPPCVSPRQTGCFCSWRTFKNGFVPKGYPLGDSIAVVNPLTWETGNSLAPKELNSGAVVRDFDDVYPGIADAQIHDGIIWTHKPKFPGSFLFWRNNYHIADLNFFYMDVRENVKDRVDAFWK